MKTILACLAILACACTDPGPAPRPTDNTVEPANANGNPVSNINAANTPPDASTTPGTVSTVMYNRVPTVPQPNPPCTSCPFGNDLSSPH